jgi:steroid delta-isomerase-like uncharacterized protein
MLRRALASQSFIPRSARGKPEERPDARLLRPRHAQHLHAEEELMAQSDIDGFVRKVLDIYNSHDPARFDELISDDCVLVRNGVAARGREEIKRVLAKLYSAMPDIQYRIDDVIAAGDKLALRWSGGGTHRGEYLGVAPTGRALSYDGMTIYERRGEQIQRIWVTANLIGLLRQMTARAPSQQPEARA